MKKEDVRGSVHESGVGPHAKAAGRAAFRFRRFELYIPGDGRGRPREAVRAGGELETRAALASEGEGASRAGHA